MRDNVIATNGNECVDIKEGASANVVEFNDCTGHATRSRRASTHGGTATSSGSTVSHGNAGGGIRLGGDTAVRRPRQHA